MVVVVAVIHTLSHISLFHNPLLTTSTAYKEISYYEYVIMYYIAIKYNILEF